MYTTKLHFPHDFLYSNDNFSRDFLRECGYRSLFLLYTKGAINKKTNKKQTINLINKETAITHSDGHVTIAKTSKITGKGQVYFIKYFLAHKKDNDNE